MVSLALFSATVNVHLTVLLNIWFLYFLVGLDDVARVPTVLVRSRRDLSHVKYIPRVLLDANKIQK